MLSINALEQVFFHETVARDFSDAAAVLARTLER